LQQTVTAVKAIFMSLKQYITANAQFQIKKSFFSIFL